jgi:hypothetical protein
MDQTHWITWIPIKETLPSPGLLVLASTTTRVMILQYHKGRPSLANDEKWRDWKGMDQGNIQFADVIAWAHLPPPYHQA